MNWDQLEGKWKQVKGSLRQQWGKLTDDDLETIAGHRDKLVGKLQERYGLAREEAQKRADDWARTTAETERMDDTVEHTGPGKSYTGRT